MRNSEINKQQPDPLARLVVLGILPFAVAAKEGKSSYDHHNTANPCDEIASVIPNAIMKCYVNKEHPEQNEKNASYYVCHILEPFRLRR